jgi:uncharacterized protein involved in outer membrane biogenesis
MKGMRAQRGKSLLIAGGFVALVVIAAIAALLLFDINTFKSNIDSAAFDATGLNVRINGKIGLSLPLAYRLRIFMSPTRMAKSFPLKTSNWGWN